MKNGLSLEELKADREKIVNSIARLQQQLVRLDGVLGYLNDNIANLEKEPENKEEGTCLEVE